ncbi:MAG: hypothetical protein AAB414_00340 [Patescibacteria group bacterium]
MNIAGYQISKIQAFTIGFLLVGIIIGVFLVQRQQTLKSKASEELYNKINVRDAECFGEGSSYTCRTQSDQVEIDISNLLP